MKRSLLAHNASDAWLRQFGGVEFPGANVIEVHSGSRTSRDRFHAEAHHAGVLGADFTYSALITADWTKPDLCADLQFRISDEGRYGVRVQAGTVKLYLFMLCERKCDDDASVIAHCRLWPAGENAADDPVEHGLGAPGAFDPQLQTLRVTVVAEGSRFVVSFGTSSTDVGRIEAENPELGVGRFGIYARAPTACFNVRFSDLTAKTDPTLASNFALLYSTPGYDIDGTKRVLVRTLNDIEQQDFNEKGSSFTVRNAAGEVKIHERRFGPSRRVAQSSLMRTFGMQLVEADFTDLREAGNYTFEARIATSTGMRGLRSNPFEIRKRLVTETMLWPLSIRNAQARRAADEDFRRNWHIESGGGSWSVGLDGAFVADRADDQAGATLRRIFNANNGPLTETNFRFVAQITIVAGCDAQLQFRITGDERWAVTLQAGDAGRCPRGAGPGAVRLHHEGPAVKPDSFAAVASHRMDSAPFKIGRAYDVEVRAQGKHIEVLLDGMRVIDFCDPQEPRPGGFGLKAWASTVRFGHVKVWGRSVGLSRPTPGVWIPYDRAKGESSQGFKITTLDSENLAMSADRQNLTYPLAAQQHGYHDCNNSIGEVTSHSMFLSALMDVWAARAHAVNHSDQESLRHAILTAVLYLNELYEQGNRSGAFAHQEPGRGAMNTKPDPILTTQFAMYGLSSFAEKGVPVDSKHACDAFELASKAWDWLEMNSGRNFCVDSIVAIRLGRAAQRQGMTSADDWFCLARKNAQAVLDHFAQQDAMKKMIRPTLRSIPWFEGVYETFKRGAFELTEKQREQLGRIASQLVALERDPANGFRVIPQGDVDRDPPDPAAWASDEVLPAHNWGNLADVPLAVKPIPKPPVGDWYICEHFVTAAADCAYIGRLLVEQQFEASSVGPTLERLATGNLYWTLGLNPGIPTTKTASSAPASGPWSAASFVYNGPGVFARTIEGFRTRETSAKGWLADWEKSTASRHRETWWIDPVANGFQSIVNGHVLRESQWHYWSVGIAGWVSGEVFMLIDGSFIKAAIALEDWHTGALPTSSPYDVTKLHFFDTTHLDRASTQWQFDDPDHTAPAQASRMATDFSAGKGFGGGRVTGHHSGELVGVLCLPVSGTTFVDIPDHDIAALAFPFDDINSANWAQVARAATEIASKRGFGAGFFTGHQVSGRRGCIGIDARLVSIFDIDDRTVAESQWAFTDINTVDWAQAARLATDVCINRGFAGGFFTGHQVPNKRQVAALRVT